MKDNSCTIQLSGQKDHQIDEIRKPDPIVHRSGHITDSTEQSCQTIQIHDNILISNQIRRLKQRHVKTQFPLVSGSKNRVSRSHRSIPRNGTLCSESINVKHNTQYLHSLTGFPVHDMIR